MPDEAPVTMAARSGMAGRARTLQCNAVRRVSLLLVLLLLCVGVAACGGDDEGDGGSSDSTAAETTTPKADVEFPAGQGKTIRALRANLPEGAVFAPAMSVLRVGENRFAFALFDTARKQIEPEAVAVYFSRTDGRGLRGPFEARQESLRVEPQFMSRQTQADLEDVQTFFVADVDVPKKGRYTFTALAQVDGQMVAASQIGMLAGAEGGPPDVGDKAIKVHTETPEDVGGNLEQIDTRIPPAAELHEKDFADVVGKEPTVLMFVTPQLCQSRVCGPVADVGLQVKKDNPDVVFIHQEVWRDNEIAKGPRPPVSAYRLVSEPWVFLVGRDGRIVERFEGALSVRELSAAVEKLKAS
jgi:hypothetical protein